MSALHTSISLLFLSLTVIGCAKNAVIKIPEAVGGSKSDGTVRMGYDYFASERVTPDWFKATLSAQNRCISWGYVKAEPFSGQMNHCIEYGAGLLVNGAMPGVCARGVVYKDFQCTN